jgi:two-component system NarL family sensor kinase
MGENTSIILITIYSSTLLIFICTMFIIYMIVVFKRKQLKSQNEIDLNKLNFEKDRLSIELEIQEQTLSHISREIHDNICLSLSLAKLHLNTYILDNTTSRQEVNDSIDLISKSLIDLNDLSKSVDGEIIKRYGLIHAIEQEVGKFEKNRHINFNYGCEGDIFFLPWKKELMIYRIIQEGLNNVLKHSKATNVILEIVYKENEMQILVADNGVGIEKSKSTQQNKRISSGLSNMHKRALQINGRLEIQSSPDNGTKLCLIVSK